MRDMTRRFVASLGIAIVGTTVVGAGIALAAELDITPSAPPPGQTELLIEVSDFDPDTAIFAVPCDIPESGDPADVTTADCDVVAVEATVTDENGEATISVTWEIPEGGIAIYVGDETRTNQIAEIIGTEAIAVEGSDTDDGATSDGATQDGATQDVAADDDGTEVEVRGTSVVQETNDTEDDLAETGPREVVVLLMVAGLLVAIGVGLNHATPATVRQD